jgi:hypothetical protein
MKTELIELEVKMYSDEAAEQDSQRRVSWHSDFQFEVLKMLLNSKITSFVIPGDFDVDEYQITELWQDLMEIRPPNLHTIDWNCNYYYMDDESRPFFNSLIAQPVLPQLEVLRLHPLKCNSLDLSNIADRLPNLRSV